MAAPRRRDAQVWIVAGGETSPRKGGRHKTAAGGPSSHPAAYSLDERPHISPERGNLDQCQPANLKRSVRGTARVGTQRSPRSPLVDRTDVFPSSRGRRHFQAMVAPGPLPRPWPDLSTGQGWLQSDWPQILALAVPLYRTRTPGLSTVIRQANAYFTTSNAQLAAALTHAEQVWCLGDQRDESRRPGGRWLVARRSPEHRHTTACGPGHITPKRPGPHACTLVAIAWRELLLHATAPCCHRESTRPYGGHRTSTSTNRVRSVESVIFNSENTLIGASRAPAAGASSPMNRGVPARARTRGSWAHPDSVSGSAPGCQGRHPDVGLSMRRDASRTSHREATTARPYGAGAGHNGHDAGAGAGSARGR
jgi:hypothetical protein